ncbi:ImmA/IrrE family metallo-endopeptidase OS=Lysinibacillus sphaericus OX=1421 GN=LS41612_10585 PE=4 SV=1 [Lysinibacillus sphaericus]
MNYSHLEDFIKEFYFKMNIITPPLLDFREIAKNLGIKVFYWSETSQALYANDLPYIFLDESLTQQQQWQDFCHELAHVLLQIPGISLTIFPPPVNTKNIKRIIL